MEKYLQNLDVWAWRYARNPRNYSGAHVSATPTACDALLRCIEGLRHEGYGARRTIPLLRLTSSDEAKIIDTGLVFSSFLKMRLELHKPTAELRQMCISHRSGVLTLAFTVDQIHFFEQGIREMKAGFGDYSMAPIEDKKLGLGDRDRASLDLWLWAAPQLR